MATLIVRLEGTEILRHDIDKRTTRIGRDVDNEIRLENPAVSRVHALVMFEDPDFVVVDQDSANGVHVNGAPTPMHRLTHGDRFEVGSYEIEFSARGAESPDRGDLALEASTSPNPVRTVVLTAVSDSDLED